MNFVLKLTKLTFTPLHLRLVGTPRGKRLQGLERRRFGGRYDTGAVAERYPLPNKCAAAAGLLSKDGSRLKIARDFNDRDYWKGVKRLIYIANPSDSEGELLG